MKRTLLCLSLFALASVAWGQKGTTTLYSGQFPDASGNLIWRQWQVYVPPVLKSPLAAGWCFHGTTKAPITAPPLSACITNMGWDSQADGRADIIVAPIGTWSSKSQSFFWEAFGAETYFPDEPNDSGFVAALMVLIDQQFGIGVNAFGRPLNFVTGFSSGGMFAHRFAAEHSLMIAAACPLSGTIWVGSSSTVTQPVAPVPICELHGDADRTINYAGGKFYGWGEGLIPFPSVDADLDYWRAADGLPPNPTPLVTNGAPTPGVLRVDGSNNGVEVLFIREINYDHAFTQGFTIGTVASFFSQYGF